MNFIKSILATAAATLLVTGCRTDYGVGNPYHPGPTAGKAVGTGVGVAAGNVAGFGVGVAEGTVAGTAAAFNPNYRVVRSWRTETTADGRIIQVPYDLMVDQNGRPVKAPAPTGNPARGQFRHEFTPTVKAPAPTGNPAPTNFPSAK